ncbi:hypothetical protein [Nocardia sp. NPDC050710]|uniref:hypothetical protein n=1 Tax=Nocardia sp. NPDC050710 TaxID=3157220 RepID=UPI0034018F07
MDSTELCSRSERLLDQLADRLPVDWLVEFRALLFAGELRLFANELMAGLVEHGIPVTAAERASLREILYSFSIPRQSYKLINNRDEAIASLVVRETAVDSSGEERAGQASGSSNDGGLGMLSPEARDRLATVTYRVDDRQVPLDSLMSTWVEGVKKINHDRLSSRGDANTWDASELVALLRVRDHIGDAVSELVEPFWESVRICIARYDDLYKSITIEDRSGWLAFKAGFDRPRQDWWWRRTPSRGPIAEEFDKFIEEYEQWKNDRDSRMQ